MTTIAYNHIENKIACDGRVTCGGVIKMDTLKKYVVRDGFILFYTGATSDVPRMVDIVSNHDGGDTVDLESEIEIEVLFIKDKCVYVASVTADNEYFIDSVECNYAIGSGSSFALAAMDFGRTAKDAVKYAMTRDVYSGGKISVCDVKTGKIK